MSFFQFMKEPAQRTIPAVPVVESSGISIRGEFMHHQIEQLEEKKKLLAEELLQLHVHIINTKKEYSLYHTALVKLKRTIEFIHNTEAHLAREKQELNEQRTLLDVQRKKSMEFAQSLPARERAVEHREHTVVLRERDILEREALLTVREQELVKKEQYLSATSARINHAQASTAAHAANISGHESMTKQLATQVLAKEAHLKSLELQLKKQLELQINKDRELTNAISISQTISANLLAEKRAFELQKQSLAKYSKDLQHHATLLQQKASDIAAKESKLLIDATSVYPYQQAASQVNSLQNTRVQLAKEVEFLQQQLAMIKAETSQANSAMIAAKNDLAMVSRQRMENPSESAANDRLELDRYVNRSNNGSKSKKSSKTKKR